MSRCLVIAALAAGTVALATPAAAQEAFTTRIEPRPFYGAVVTMEAGVRVFRPLPPTRQVIINPGGQTPLNLGYYDTRVYEYSRSDNYHYNYDQPNYGYGGGGGFPAFTGKRHHRGHMHKGKGTFGSGH